MSLELTYQSGFDFMGLLLVALLPAYVMLVVAPFIVSFLQHNLSERGRMSGE